MHESTTESRRKGRVKEEKSRRGQPAHGTLSKAGEPSQRHAAEWAPIGSFQYIDQAKIEEFRDFWKSFYMPNNATLAVAGDINVEETKKLIEEYFGPIPKGPSVQRPKIDWKLDVPGAKKDVLKDNTPLPATLHAWRAPTETDPDAYALELLGNILSTGRSSRLYKRMVEKEQVAMEVEAFPFLLEKAGMLGVYVIGQQGVPLDKLDALITEEVEKVKSEGVTEEEFQKARNNKEAEFGNVWHDEHARQESRATAFMATRISSTPSSTATRREREDLQRVAKKYFTKEGTNVLRYPVPATPPLPKPIDYLAATPSSSHSASSSAAAPAAIDRNKNLTPIRARLVP